MTYKFGEKCKSDSSKNLCLSLETSYRIWIKWYYKNGKLEEDALVRMELYGIGATMQYSKLIETVPIDFLSIILFYPEWMLNIIHKFKSKELILECHHHELFLQIRQLVKSVYQTLTDPFILMRTHLPLSWWIQFHAYSRPVGGQVDSNNSCFLESLMG